MRPKTGGLVITALVLLVFCGPVGARAPVGDTALRDGGAIPAVHEKWVIPYLESFSLGPETERFLGSHTSYEFGNPYPPYQKPLSRLEFPMDSWWVGGKMRANFSRFSVGGEFLTNASQQANGHMRDSDWDDDTHPSLKTIYSESQCHIATSYIASTDMDLKISDWTYQPQWLDLRPLAGFRCQNLHFVTHDGEQRDLTTGETTPLPGNGIDFKQKYRQYFVGGRAAIDLGKPFRLESLVLLLQFDWAYVEGANVDHHLLREGNRFTYEDTRGDGRHGTAGVKAGLTKNLSLTMQADFLSLSTTGWHRLVNPTYDMDMRFNNGVKVWSDQNTLSLTLAYAF
ncbi:MAG: omptin family outer membrane protease [Syntrophobacteraceae bacterium]|nr:omptin family outer membrane protease [Syntrophobacteraceae bacterium]